MWQSHSLHARQIGLVIRATGVAMVTLKNAQGSLPRRALGIRIRCDFEAACVVRLGRAFTKLGWVPLQAPNGAKGESLPTR